MAARWDVQWERASSRQEPRGASMACPRLGRCRGGQGACEEERDPHLRSLPVDDVPTGRGSHVVLPLFPYSEQTCPLMAIRQLAPSGGWDN